MVLSPPSLPVARMPASAPGCASPRVSWWLGWVFLVLGAAAKEAAKAGPRNMAVPGSGVCSSHGVSMEPPPASIKCPGAEASMGRGAALTSNYTVSHSHPLVQVFLSLVLFWFLEKVL